MKFSASEIRKITETIITNLINSRKRKIEFHRLYPQYPNKINIYESFSNMKRSKESRHSWKSSKQPNHGKIVNQLKNEK